MNSVDHIPQTFASHVRLPEDSLPQKMEEGVTPQHGADMLKPDPRDTFYSSNTVHQFRLSVVFVGGAVVLAFRSYSLICVPFMYGAKQIYERLNH